MSLCKDDSDSMLIVMVSDLEEIKARRIFLNGTIEGSDVIDIYNAGIQVTRTSCVKTDTNTFSFIWQEHHTTDYRGNKTY